ncbi:LigT-like protein [Agrocybe pediades]|nr:LigT-like protein [Agrocybe pediades]
MGLSLWIVPNENDAQKIESIMTIRQREPGLAEGTYPKFYPHITLASLPLSMENENNLDKIDASIRNFEQPVQCSFASVDIGSHYFRSVYVSIKLDQGIKDLHRHVHESLGVEPRTPSFPHMSLCYIADEDAGKGEKERFYEELKSSGRLVDGESGSAGLNYGVGGKNGWVDSFRGHEVWTVRCEGPVEGWVVLKKTPLK